MRVFHEPAAWWLAGLVLGGVVVALRLALNERIGILGGYSDVVARVTGRASALGWKAAFLGGVVLGGLVYALVAGGYQGARPYGWIADAFPGHASLATVIALTLGGILIGFGAKTAGGCTSGNGLGGTTAGSIASFAATATFFATAVAASFLLRGAFGA